MKQRTAIVGTHGVGKTTIHEALKEHLPHNFIKEQATQITKDWGKTVPEILQDEKLYEEFQLEILRRQKDLEKPPFVADRSQMDTLAYATDEFAERVKSLISMDYDGLIYVPIEFNPEMGENRVDDLEYRAEVDRKMKKLVEGSGVPFIEVRGSIEDRVNQVIDFIS